MMDVYETVASTLAQLREAQRSLERQDVLRSKRVTGDLGEWLASEILGVPRCENRVMKGWDLETDGRRIQVKAHSKAATNTARRSALGDELLFDELAVVVLDEDYLLREFYLAPVAEVERLTMVDGIRKDIGWNALAPFDIRSVPSRFGPLLAPNSHLTTE